MNDLSPRNPVTRARDLVPLIAAEADAIERERRLTKPMLEELHEARLFRMLYPRSVGGDEVEPAAYIEAVGELARADGSVGWCVSIANSIGLFAPYLQLEGARSVWAAARDLCLGSTQRMPRHRGARRIPDHRSLGLRKRVPPFYLDGRARHRCGAGRLVAAQ